MKNFTCTDVVGAFQLELGRRAGAEQRYRCPNHDDRHPSLSLNPAKDVWFCGPCDKSGNAWALAAFLGGIDPDDKPAMNRLLAKHGLVNGPKPNGADHGQIVDRYPYPDEGGKLLYEVVRFEPKDFRQRRPDGNGGWISNMDGVRRVLYRLPELLKADDVFIVEGEKDADALCVLGLTATTNAGGAGKWRLEYSLSFKPHQSVTILPDNDDAGRKHAQQVAESLSEKVTSLKVIELDGLPVKGDVSDWIQQRRDKGDDDSIKEELLSIIERAPEWTPSSPSPSDTKTDANTFVPPAHWKCLDLADLDEWECEPLVPIIGGIIAHGNLVYVAAETQTGKTLLGLYIARKLIQGSDLFGKYPITTVDRLLYFILEDPDRRAKDRLMDTKHEFPSERVDRDHCKFWCAPGFRLDDDRIFRWLESVITSEKREVVFLDTYQKATPGISSFDDEKQSLILHKMADLTRRLGITLIILDHVRKGQGGSKRRNQLSIDDIKGTGGKAQNADCVILMERTPDRKQIKFQSFSKDFDQPVRILLNVAPKGSTEPKFTYAADLEALGVSASERGTATRKRVFEAMKPGEWDSAPILATKLRIANSTVQTHLKTLAADHQVEDNGLKGKYKAYRRIAETQSGDTTGDSTIKDK